ncbi:hypothetical protein SCP_0411800 [Sparassis crispa]|uniref:Uncharacterized protein n=1 Tax=Sparassis crispa TaxID=139825 RepID=A0A401GKU3_9APHY|nr:hypothetical protein SCP_0411800 [Sparassis crispa]GBE82795.1 hypothetical protein SCP_0411800 [Sparassis crispa]
MSNSESSLEPEVVVKSTKKSSKDKAKKTSKHSKVDAGKNEGTDPDWAFKPPKGAVLMNHGVDSGEFDWDAINDDDNVELWLIRVPDGMKPKYLQDIKLDVPSSSKTTRIGSIDRKHTSYDVWSLGDDEIEGIGGEELKEFSCLLPRPRKGGKLYQAPKPVTRRLIVSAKPALPTPDPSSDSNTSSSVYKNPPRPRYPKAILKHRFMPLGSLARNADSPEAMDVDQVEQILGEEPADEDIPVKPSKPKKAAHTEKVEGTTKKRKGNGDSPKKSKKTKTAVE